jgi:diacylglycerol kinase
MSGTTEPETTPEIVQARTPLPRRDPETFRTQRAKSLAASFRFAFKGLSYLLRSQRNARIHVGILGGVVAVGIFTGLSPIEWAIFAGMAGLVMYAEATNTALEAIVDLASPTYHPLARIAKDVAAAGVLMCAAAAVAVGALIFLSHWL